MIIKLKKFRAWDRQEKKMLSSKEFSGEKDLYLTLNGGIMKVNPVGNRYAIAEESYPIMQYTGRTDKNGKEIYEGDITNYGEVVWCDSLSWDSGGSDHPGFYFKDASYGNGDLDYGTGFNDDIEVKGNIYENPELLSVKR